MEYWEYEKIKVTIERLGPLYVELDTAAPLIDLKDRDIYRSLVTDLWIVIASLRMLIGDEPTEE